MTECCVIKGFDPEKFTNRINEMLGHGWRLAGPVTAAQHIDAMWLVATLLRDRDDER